MSRSLAVVLLLATPIAAQVPQGWYVFSTFGSAGQKGLFLSHPRNPGKPTEVSGLRGELVTSGASCAVFRPHDGAIICGERAQVNSSVDVHVVELQGTRAVRDASFSVGTGGPCCGEIPQLGLLPDGRVVVAATDLSAGPLANYKTTSYGIQGLGIVDTSSGAVVPIPISNGSTILDVFNGLALAPDCTSVYLGTYVSSTQGDIYRVPMPNGGAATKIASVPAGLSNMAFDNNGELWVTTLDPSKALYRVNVSTGKVVHVPQTNGSLNAIANEAVTGNFAVVSARSGTPSRSIFWMAPDGTHHLLSTPGLGTPSGISFHPNPARFGNGTATNRTFDWELAPNPGGLPTVGNGKFSLTVQLAGSMPAMTNVSALCLNRLDQPVQLLGADIWVDLSSLLLLGLHPPTTTITIPLGIPNASALVGVQLFLQTLHQEVAGPVGATPGVSFTVL